MSGKILIMGAGNTVMADEGIGPRCIEELERCFDFPDNVELMDAGTMGLSIIDVLRDVDHLIVIDAAKDTGHPAGTVILFTPEELAKSQVLHSAHDMRLIDVLNSAKMMDVELASAVIVAIQVESIAQWVLELSTPVQAALPIACACALDQLKGLGICATQKDGIIVDPVLVDALENFAPEAPLADDDQSSL